MLVAEWLPTRGQDSTHAIADSTSLGAPVYKSNWCTAGQALSPLKLSPGCLQHVKHHVCGRNLLQAAPFLLDLVGMHHEVGLHVGTLDLRQQTDVAMREGGSLTDWLAPKANAKG